MEAYLTGKEYSATVNGETYTFSPNKVRLVGQDKYVKSILNEIGTIRNSANAILNGIESPNASGATASATAANNAGNAAGAIAQAAGEAMLNTEKTADLTGISSSAAAKEDANKHNIEKTSTKNTNELFIKLTDSIPLLENDTIVYTATGNEFAVSKKKLSQQVYEYFESLGGIVHRENFGDVAINDKGVDSSIAHGMGRAKAIAFASVPSVIEKGRQIDFAENWKGRNYDSYVFAAPIQIGAQRAYVAVVVTKSNIDNRYYLHEVSDNEGNIITIKKDDVSFKSKSEATNGSSPLGETSSSNTISQNSNVVNPDAAVGKIVKSALTADSDIKKLENALTEKGADTETRREVAAAASKIENDVELSDKSLKEISNGIAAITDTVTGKMPLSSGTDGAFWKLYGANFKAISSGRAIENPEFVRAYADVYAKALKSANPEKYNSAMLSFDGEDLSSQLADTVMNDLTVPENAKNLWQYRTAAVDVKKIIEDADGKLEKIQNAVYGKKITLTQTGDVYEAHGAEALELAKKLNLNTTEQTVNGEKTLTVKFPVTELGQYKEKLGREYNLVVEDEFYNTFTDGEIRETVENESTFSYTDKEKQNWESSKDIIVYESDEQFEAFVKKVLNNEDTHKKIYFGKIPDKTAQTVLDKTGVNISGHNIALKGYEIRKILLNSHGNEKSEALRGQEPITINDLKNIYTIIANPDEVRLSEKEYEGKPTLVFEKTIDGKNYVVAYVSRKHHDIAIQTMYKKRSLATAENANAPSSTSKTTSSTASDNTIPQNSGVVKLPEAFSRDKNVQLSMMGDTFSKK